MRKTSTVWVGDLTIGDKTRFGTVTRMPKVIAGTVTVGFDGVRTPLSNTVILRVGH